MEEGIGLYAHIPFCISRCGYCAFESRAGTPPPGFAEAMIKEAELLSPGRISTFHAGGGTPTLMEPRFWKAFLSMHDLSFCQEAAIETNPAALGTEGYRVLREAGFDRVSIGVQSFSEENLGFLGRAHSAEQAVEAVSHARRGGFTNISMDLIYGLPGQTLDQWRHDLKRALSLSPGHLSCYELTLEPGTRIGDAGAKASDPLNARMFMEAHDILAGEGFSHYEVSNYALPGMESRHNSAYWSRKPYAGVGPSAHGFTGTSRYWNTRDTNRYIGLLERGVLPREGEEAVTGEIALQEEIMLGLRTSRGVSLSLLPEEGVRMLVKRGWLETIGERAVPTPEGMLWSDWMARELTP